MMQRLLEAKKALCHCPDQNPTTTDERSVPVELPDEESLEARNSKGSLKGDGIELADILVVERIVDTCIWKESLCQVNSSPQPCSICPYFL